MCRTVFFSVHLRTILLLSLRLRQDLTSQTSNSAHLGLAQGDTKTAEAALQTSLTDVSSADLGSWTEDLLMLAESHHLSIASSKGNAAQNVPVSASRCHSVSAQNYQPSV